MKLPSGGAVHVEGAPNADPILFLHGAGGGAWSWKPQRAALGASWRLFVWEARGHGSAARVADAGLADYYVDAREAMAAVIDLVRRPAFVVGHSMGALLSMALACDVGAAVKGLFLIDPVYFTRNGERGILPAALMPLARVAAGPLLRSYQKNGAISRRLTRWLFERAFADRERMEAAWPDQRAQVPFEYPQFLREALGAPSGFALRDFGAELAEPTFLIEHTRSGGEPRFPQLVATLGGRLGPNFHHEAIVGGHNLQLDRPDAVNEYLRQFLARYGMSNAPAG